MYVCPAQVLLQAMEGIGGGAGACLETGPALMALLSQLMALDKSGEIWHGAASVASTYMCAVPDVFSPGLHCR